jgi:hypothetical protein
MLLVHINKNPPPSSLLLASSPFFYFISPIELFAGSDDTRQQLIRGRGMWTELCVLAFSQKFENSAMPIPKWRFAPFKVHFYFIPLHAVYIRTQLHFQPNKNESSEINLKKLINLKVSIGSDFSIGDCGNGREKSATDGRYICVCLLCIHTLSGFSQHTHTQPSVCVCVWYSSKSARTGHVSFSQTLSTERNGLYLTSALNCLSCFSLAPSSVCVCVCVSGCLYLFTIS